MYIDVCLPNETYWHWIPHNEASQYRNKILEERAKEFRKSLETGPDHRPNNNRNVNVRTTQTGSHWVKTEGNNLWAARTEMVTETATATWGPPEEDRHAMINQPRHWAGEADTPVQEECNS